MAKNGWPAYNSSMESSAEKTLDGWRNRAEVEDEAESPASGWKPAAWLLAASVLALLAVWLTHGMEPLAKDLLANLHGGIALATAAGIAVIRWCGRPATSAFMRRRLAVAAMWGRGDEDSSARPPSGEEA